MNFDGHGFDDDEQPWTAQPSAAPWPILRLSMADLEHLREKNRLDVAPDGPLASLLGPFLVTSGEERRRTARYLREHGLLPAEDGSETEPTPFRQALDIVARPEATLTVRYQSVGSMPALIPLYLANGVAAPAFLDDDGLHLGVPLDKDQIVESIQEKLLDEIPPELEAPVSLSRLSLRAAEILWTGTEREPSELIPHWLAFSALAQQLPEPGHVSALLEEVVAEGVIEELVDGYRLARAYRPWIEHWLSGLGCTVDYCPIAEGAGEDPASQPHRLSFYGAPGTWVVGTPDLPAALTAALDEAGRQRPGRGPGAPWWRPEEVGASLEACDRWTFAAPPARALGWHLGRLLAG
ncbi:MAG: hypothetical protein KDD11_05795 [Acidobacteria bacterium]|nr:hypothetical protein [Acidobacteriota bacterium]